jgi:hypothetical protein
MKTTVPFTVGGYPVDELDQATMRCLRRRADRDGVTVEDLIGTWPKRHGSWLRKMA